MRILTYKRTHTGDQNSAGEFGINDCMGRVRGWNFDAVIGVGGYDSGPQSYGIEGRVNWVGLNPTWTPHPQGDGLLVTFEFFPYMKIRIQCSTYLHLYLQGACTRKRLEYYSSLTCHRKKLRLKL